MKICSSLASQSPPLSLKSETLEVPVLDLKPFDPHSDSNNSNSDSVFLLLNIVFQDKLLSSLLFLFYSYLLPGVPSLTPSVSLTSDVLEPLLMFSTQSFLILIQRLLFLMKMR